MIFGKRKKAAEPVILAEDQSPVCNVQAFVEDNGSCVYFYLWFDPGEERGRIKSCWVCNRGPAPQEIDSEAMDQGRAPMMPAEFVGHDPEGTELSGELSVVWFEEGDAAALLEDGRLIAVIPGWSGEGFYGYSRYARGQGPFAWELDQAERVLQERTDRSKKYWEYIDGDYWEELQGRLMDALFRFFGEYENYYAIDGGHFPTKALVTGRKNGVRYAVTAGTCALVQPLVEQYFQEKAGDFRRIELGFACREDALDEESYRKALSYVSGQTQLPWGVISWLGHGHTIPCDVIDGFAAVMLLNAALMPELPSPDYGSFMGQRVNLLWMVPLTADEYRQARQLDLGSMMERCRCRLEELAVFDGKAKFSGD